MVVVTEEEWNRLMQMQSAPPAGFDYEEAIEIGPSFRDKVNKQITHYYVRLINSLDSCRRIIDDQLKSIRDHVHDNQPTNVNSMPTLERKVENLVDDVRTRINDKEAAAVAMFKRFINDPMIDLQHLDFSAIGLVNIDQFDCGPEESLKRIEMGENIFNIKVDHSSMEHMAWDESDYTLHDVIADPYLYNYYVTNRHGSLCLKIKEEKIESPKIKKDDSNVEEISCELSNMHIPEQHIESPEIGEASNMHIPEQNIESLEIERKDDCVGAISCELSNMHIPEQPQERISVMDGYFEFIKDFKWLAESSRPDGFEVVDKAREEMAQMVAKMVRDSVPPLDSDVWRPKKKQ